MKILNGREVIVWTCPSKDCDGGVAVSIAVWDNSRSSAQVSVARMVEKHLTQHLTGDSAESMTLLS